MPKNGAVGTLNPSNSSGRSLGPVVFLLQHDPSRNFLPARRFGNIVPILNKDVFPDNVEERVKKITSAVVAAMTNYRESADYLILSGDPVSIFLAGAITALMGNTQNVRLLKWDKELRGYYQVSVDMDSVLDETNQQMGPA